MNWIWYLIVAVVTITIVILLIIRKQNQQKKATAVVQKTQNTLATVTTQPLVQTPPAHTQVTVQTQKSYRFWNFIKILVTFVIIAGLVVLLVWAIPTKVIPWWHNITRDKPKPQLHYIAVDNWVPDPENTRTVYFISEYKEVINFTGGQYDLRLSFSNSTTSYCVRDFLTGVYNCGEANEDVEIPKSPTTTICLMFKTNDGQKCGKIDVIAEKNIKKSMLVQ